MLSKKRILLLPGYGCNALSFSEIEPFLADYTVEHIDYRAITARFTNSKFNLRDFVNQLIVQHRITTKDILIGHSMGGFIAYNISQIVRCEVCLIGSFTDVSRIVRLAPIKLVSDVFITLGGLKWSRAHQYLLKRRQQRPQSLPAFEAVLDNFMNYYTTDDLLKLSQLAYAPALAHNKPPSLRIHSKIDKIVLPPLEPYTETPGDHFNLLTHPKEVGKVLTEWLHSITNEIVEV